jgi:hypothetical protein
LAGAQRLHAGGDDELACFASGLTRKLQNHLSGAQT